EPTIKGVKKEKERVYDLSGSGALLNVWRVEKTGATQLTVTETRNEENILTYTYAYDAVTGSWSLATGDGKKLVTQTEAWNEEAQELTVTEIVQEKLNTPVVSSRQTISRKFAWGYSVV